MLRILLLASILGAAGAQCEGEKQDCNIGGIIAACICGTLVFVGIILLIVWLVRRRRKQRQQQQASFPKSRGHDNPALVQDVEAGNNNAASASAEEFKRLGFRGYSPCREYVRPVRNAKVIGANGSAGQLVYERSPDFPGHPRGVRYLTKAGSHGSLDNSTNPLQGETVEVPLHSQDIIGLGFNIQGNISDGIYVSQVHNRGPAKESGHIQQGDRIMSVSISFENMVHEDALTILSYAAPYPVTLTIQKVSKPYVVKATEPHIEDSDGVGVGGEESVALTHPIYRSQSYDDVSKIAPEVGKWIGPRRTWSEMKKGHPMRNQVELDEGDATGRLKKWGAQHNILHPEGAQYSVEDELMNDDDHHRDLSTESNSNNQGADLSLESAQGVDLDGMTEQDHNQLMSLSYENPELEKKELELNGQLETEAGERADVEEIQGVASYSAKSTLEIRKPGGSDASLSSVEELEVAVNTQLPDTDDVELEERSQIQMPDLRAPEDEDWRGLEAALEAGIVPELETSEVQAYSNTSPLALDVDLDNKLSPELDEAVTQVQASVHENAPEIMVDSSGTTQASDVHIEIPDGVEKDNAVVTASAIADMATVDIEKVAESESPPSSPSATVKVEKETGGFLDKLRLKKKRRRSSDSSSSLTSSSSSSSSDDIKRDLNRNKGDATNANIRPSSISSPEDIAFSTELQLPEGLAIEPEDRQREVVNGGVQEEEIVRNLESHLMAGRDESNLSMLVNVDSSSELTGQVRAENNEDVDVAEEDLEIGSEEEQTNMVRSVLKDYFGDKPSLLEQFGFDEEQKESSVVREGGLAFEITESDLNSQPLETQAQAPKPKSKGGMAYFVTIDDEKNASLTDPYYYQPPLSNMDGDDDNIPIIPSTSAPIAAAADRAETPDLFANDKMYPDITQLRLETITTTTTSSSVKTKTTTTTNESPPPAMISLNTELESDA